MRYLRLILLLLIGCEEPTDCAGITDGSAYLDDCEQCVSGTTGFIENYLKDCAGECGGSAVIDECGVCEGDGSPCNLACPEGTDVCLTLNDTNLSYDSSEDISGFQFSHNGCVTSASGGDAAANGFAISSSGTAVIAFSFTGAVIPAGAGTLVELGGDISEECLFDFVFSDASGNGLDVAFVGTE